MKKLFALALVVLGLAACQTEPNELDVNVGGEVLTTVNISIPETDTRSNSALGAFENVDLDGDLTIRYILQVFTADGQASSHRDVKYEDDKSVAFDVRLIPGRDYKFVCWADIVSETAKADVHYKTDDLTNIELIGDWNAMDETRDAFTVSAPVTNYNGASVINIELKRPFAKLRVKTTDLVELGYFGVTPRTAKVTYSTSHRAAFDAFVSKAKDATLSSEDHEYTILPYGDNNETTMTLFTDYFFAEEDIVKFELEVFDANGESIRVIPFSTDIPVKRNYVTTIAGNILTDGNNVTVTVNDAFENVDDNGNTTNPDYDYETISSAAEFYAAVNSTTSGNYILISNLNLTGVSTSSLAATRTNAGKTINIDLNGLTINVDNQSDVALVTLAADDALIFSGSGSITATDSSKKLVEGGNVVVTGAATVDNKAANAKTGIEALKFICANGGEFTFASDLTGNVTVDQKPGVKVTIDGANYRLNGCITVDGKSATYTTAGLTIKNLVFDADDINSDACINLGVSGNNNTRYTCNVTVDNCTFGVAGAVGIKSYTGGDKNLVINKCIATDKAHSLVQAKGIDGVTVTGCTVMSKNGMNFNNSDNVAIENCTTDVSGYAVRFGESSGGSGAAETYSIKNSVLKAACEDDGDAVIVLRGTADNSTLTIENTTLDGKRVILNTASNANVYVVVNNSNQLAQAITAGETTIYLAEGTYVIPTSAQGKTLTIKGVGNAANTKIATNNETGSYEGCNYALDGSTVTFENISINTPSTTYIGYARCEATYKNCIFNGTYTLYDNSTFVNCTFDVSGDVYNIWTWGAPVATFTDCTFNSDGKAMLLYGQANTKLTVNNSVFNDKGGLTDLKAAIEIGNDYNTSYELVVNKTVVNGYEINDKGINTGTTLWANKNSMGKDKLNVVVDGVDVY